EKRRREFEKRQEGKKKNKPPPAPGPPATRMIHERKAHSTVRPMTLQLSKKFWIVQASGSPLSTIASPVIPLSPKRSETLRPTTMYAGFASSPRNSSAESRSVVRLNWLVFKRS